MAFTLFRLSCLLVAVAASLSSLELLSIRDVYAETGLLAGRVHHTFGAAATRALLVSRLVVALLIGALAVTGDPAAAGATCAALATLLVTQALMVHRLGWACDGADYMLTILIAGLASFTVTRTAGFAFIAIQSCLAYASAGVAKLRSPLWRSGEAIARIVSTTTFGEPRVGRWLRTRPTVSRLAAWSVIALECAFPLAVVAPRTLMIAILAAGAAFHVIAAGIMGVNGFVWSFGGTYPSIVLVHALLHHGAVA